MCTVSLVTVDSREADLVDPDILTRCQLLKP